jgi:hypothetical protein
MRRNRLRTNVIVTAMMALCLAGCITRTRRLTPDQVPLPAETISKPALLEKIKASSVALKTLQVLNSTLKVTQKISADQLKEFGKGSAIPITGVIFVERPSKLRLQVQLSGAVTAADLTSDERQFKINIPHGLNAFGVGNVTAPVGEVSFPCSLRPSHILDALFVDGEKYIGIPGFTSIRWEKTEGIRSYYYILFAKNDSPIQQLKYDRTDKQVVQKIQFLEDGSVEADVRYSNYMMVNSISFPKVIEIDRPIERYTLEMKISEAVFNETIPESKFVLDRPPNANDLDMRTCKTVKRP